MVGPLGGQASGSRRGNPRPWSGTRGTGIRAWTRESRGTYPEHSVGQGLGLGTEARATGARAATASTQMKSQMEKNVQAIAIGVCRVWQPPRCPCRAFALFAARVRGPGAGGRGDGARDGASKHRWLEVAVFLRSRGSDRSGGGLRILPDVPPGR